MFLDEASSIAEVEEAGIRLFRFIYNTGTQSLARARYTTFSKQAAAAKINPKSLPPTDGAAKQHALRAFLQLWDWATLTHNPLDYGWRIAENKYELIPSMDHIAPRELLELTHCSCTTNCNNRRCSCKKNDLKCISACANCKGTGCQNSMSS